MSDAAAVSTNPFSSAVAPANTGALAQSDAQRAIAEVQAALMIARMNPRDQKRAVDLILQDCTRPSLAEKAVYAYARGGLDISGPSIRLAEVLAQRWGNISYGVRELEQRDGESVIQAFAWDVESNTRREMTFTAPHVRDTKRGRVELTDARDIYEMTANQGARRVRACILGIIPGDVVEMALKQCEVTASTKADVTPARVADMLSFFAGLGVTKELVEKRIQRRVEAITPALFLQLGKIANSLRDGMSSAGDWFELAPAIREVQRKADAPPAPPAAAPAAGTTPDASPSPSASPAGSPGQTLVDALEGKHATPPDPPAPAALPSKKASTYDPVAAYQLAKVWQPNTRKPYHMIETTSGVVLHAWSSTVIASAKAACESQLAVRLVAESVNFPAAPWRVTKLELVEEREPGEDG